MTGLSEDRSAPICIDRLTTVVAASIGRWPVPVRATVRLINVAENWTYLVSASGWRSVLRVHRPGYHTLNAIRSELVWQGELRADSVVDTPGIIAGVDGDLVQEITFPEAHAPLRMVMFAFVKGEQPHEDQDLAVSFQTLGQIAARLHKHTQDRQVGTGFERLSWDTATILGPVAPWGDWRAAPNVTQSVCDVLERVEQAVTTRLAAYGKARDRFGLIHADMRLANLLVDGATVRLIDFDDCGFGWYLYDFATAISFMEDHPQVPALRAAWIEGYRSERSLDEVHIAELDTLVMLRRLALLAWVGSHMDATEPQVLAPDFARVSAELGVQYLNTH